MESRNRPSPQLTILISLTAVFPFLASLLLRITGVPWGGTFQPQDNLTNSVIGKPKLKYYLIGDHRRTLRPWSDISLHIGWTLVFVGLLYGLFVWCHFGTRERQRKISIFMAVFVSVMTVSLFVFTVCLCALASMIPKKFPDSSIFEYGYTYVRSQRKTLIIRNSVTYSLIPENIWNKVQVVFQCCGCSSYTDWTRIEQDIVPDSCCKIHKSGCGKNFTLENIYQKGCEGELTEHIKHQYIIQTHDEQIVYLLVSIVFGVAAILITFFSVKAWYNCENNHGREDGYMLVNNEEDDFERLNPFNEAENPEDQLVYILNFPKTNQYNFYLN